MNNQQNENTPDLSRHAVFKGDLQLIPGVPSSSLTVLANYSPFYHLGVIQCYLPAGVPANRVRGFRADQYMEATDKDALKAEAERIFSSLSGQLFRVMQRQRAEGTGV